MFRPYLRDVTLNLSVLALTYRRLAQALGHDQQQILMKEDWTLGRF